MTLTVAASAFFEPARTATIPNITGPAEAGRYVPTSALTVEEEVLEDRLR
jgi:hypothetical protein